MTRLWAVGELIEVGVNGAGRVVRFRWQGRVYQVERLQQEWVVDTDWWEEGGRVWRAYLAVTTVQGVLCVIYQDLLGEGWYLSKVYD